MKKIYFKIGLVLGLSSLLFFALTIIYTAYHGLVRNIHQFNDIIFQIQTNIENQKTISKIKSQEMRDHYLHIATLISRQFKTIDSNYWNDILQDWVLSLQIPLAALITQDGQIKYCSNMQMINHYEPSTTMSINYFKQHPQATYYFYQDTSTNESTFLVLPIDSLYLMMDINLASTSMSSQSHLICNSLKQLTLTQGTAVYALDQTNLQLLAKTESHLNNILPTSFNQDKLAQYASKQVQFIWEKTKGYLVKVTSFNGMYIIILREMSLVARQILYQVSLVIFLDMILCFCVIFSLSFLLKKYLFNDLTQINRQIKAFTMGHYQVHFQKCQLPELEQTIEVVRELKAGFIHKHERMNKLFDSISNQIAAFECLSVPSGQFYSTHLWSILNMASKEKEYFEQHPEAFKQFIAHLVQNQKEDHLVLYQGKYLEIHTHTIEDEFIGVLIDRTRQEKEALNLKHSLDLEKRKHKRDDLTGLLTRTTFQQAVNKHLLAHQSGTLLLLDLDHFKVINDSLGHPEGDQVLIHFSHFLKEIFRKSDSIARLGGDEFVVFMPGTIDRSNLIGKLESLLVQSKTLFYRYRSYRLSVSIGVSLIDLNKKITTYDQLYKSADCALYIAKRKGKNQFYINDEGIQCMVKTCHYCRQECPRRDILGLEYQRRNNTDV